VLASLKIYFRKKEGKVYRKSYAQLLQGVLMQYLDEHYVKILHSDGYHPYSQSVYMQEEFMIWKINTLNMEALHNIIHPMMKISGIYIEKDHEYYDIIKKEYEEISYEELANQYLFSDESRYITVLFDSPTAFKQDGEYNNIPDVGLLFQSLMLKYDAVSQKSCMYDRELKDEFSKYVRICKYHLRSTSFLLRNINIPSFVGQITLKINGPKQMVNLAKMLFVFGTYSGIGIKTGMGMGSYRILEKENTNEPKKE